MIVFSEVSSKERLRSISLLDLKSNTRPANVTLMSTLLFLELPSLLIDLRFLSSNGSIEIKQRSTLPQETHGKSGLSITRAARMELLRVHSPLFPMRKMHQVPMI